ncbi:hypothetical protein [Burkholderia cenocepacia]|uniref:hypothetical protein n=1 Tax=Burkholderia cenocepacia TaxID=95486 RepID=UPI0021AB4488|nr:hypothetical protein [Burkholderia cenocepacia]
MEAQLADGRLDTDIAFEPVHTAEIESEPSFRETPSLFVGGGHARATRRKRLSAQDRETGEKFNLIYAGRVVLHYIVRTTIRSCARSRRPIRNT